MTVTIITNKLLMFKKFKIIGSDMRDKMIPKLLFWENFEIKMWCKWSLSGLRGFLFFKILIINNLTKSNPGINIYITTLSA